MPDRPSVLHPEQAHAFRLLFDYPGGVRDVVREAQRRIGTTPDGQPGPMTRAAFNYAVPHEAAQYRYPAPAPRRTPPRNEPPWLSIGRSVIGLHEVRDNAKLATFLRSDGHALGDPKVLPWCGDLVETCIRLSLPGEPIPENPYLARNWLKFGVETQATLGAIAVFWRGSRGGTSGHVGFVVGMGRGVVYVLAGNQSNEVNISPLSTDRLLGYRWPATVQRGPIYLPAMTGGTVSTNEG